VPYASLFFLSIGDGERKRNSNREKQRTNWRHRQVEVEKRDVHIDRSLGKSFD
jgi:hypothetical protein